MHADTDPHTLSLSHTHWCFRDWQQQEVAGTKACLQQMSITTEAIEGRD